MTLAFVHTRAQLGVQAPPVTVETHLSKGLPSFTVVGLPETAVKESKDRVRSAIINSHFEFPARRITVNLAPADLPKEGGRFDLAIALGILAASEQIPGSALQHTEFIGELGLGGELRPVRGSLPVALACDAQQRTLIAPVDNSDELVLSRNSKIRVAASLLEVCAHLHERELLQQPTQKIKKKVKTHDDLSDVKGQQQARRALEIAAAGGHNVLFFGPPGTGKSMLASRLPGIMPELEEEEAIQVAVVQSVSASSAKTNWRQRPFRAPHHTASAAALVGGGGQPRPGEITLAHKGVLFLDELPEFSRHVLEVLREPLETGHICISRAKSQLEFPAQFQLVAAMNPCPCGYLGDGTERCTCTPPQITRYRSKISGPLLDRIDMHVPVQSLSVSEIQSKSEGESSAVVRERVKKVREKQMQRQNKTNAVLKGKELEQFAELGEQEKKLLAKAMTQLCLSARAYQRILRVGRTIADMADSEHIASTHIAEALAYRGLNNSAV